MGHAVLERLKLCGVLYLVRAEAGSQATDEATVRLGRSRKDLGFEGKISESGSTDHAKGRQ